MKKLGEGSTPGPWRVSQGGKYIQYCQPGTILNICEMQNVDIDEDEANALLISKAPLLVEARNVLEKIANGEVMDQNNNPYNHADTVIAYQKLARALLTKLDS